MKSVVVVDYGMGNLFSVSGALNYLGYTPLLSSDPKTIEAAEAILLPGVGSFRQAMQRLDGTGLSDALREAVLIKKRKILGICLGQQLMASYGEEDGGGVGLGFIDGNVLRFPSTVGLKVPHIGFNTVVFDSGSRLVSGMSEEVDVYFVHSYRMIRESRPGLAGYCIHGSEFVAAYEHENIFATQFHPEKSQTNGLKMLTNFLEA